MAAFPLEIRKAINKKKPGKTGKQSKEKIGWANSKNNGTRQVTRVQNHTRTCGKGTKTFFEMF